LHARDTRFFSNLPDLANIEREPLRMTTFRYLTAGESHGPGLTVIVEGMPAGLGLTEEYIEAQMARRQKGYGSGGRMKIEKDRADIRSGVRHGVTLGSPIAMWIENRDFANWTDAMAIAEVGDEVDKKVYTKIVPGHADFPGALKYVQHDLRNVLERASARETAARVAAGSIARRLLEEIGISIHSRAVATGDEDGSSVATEDVDWKAVEASEVRASDPDADARFKAAIDKSKADRTTIGGVFEVVAFGAPVGLGSHVHWDRKLDGRLAQMSNGNPIVVNVAIKPIATMTNPLPSVDINTGAVVEAAYNRSDICQVARACPVGEAMMALVLVEAMLEKFGGDSLDEIKRNYTGYVESHQAFGNA
jgi:chorismate synthase